MTRHTWTKALIATVITGSLVIAGTTGAHAAPTTDDSTVSASTSISAHASSEPAASPANVAGETDLPQGEAAAVPIIVAIIAVIVKFGAKQAASQFGKAAVKEAFKKSVLSLNANKWNHITQTKHNWSKLGAQGNKDRIADLIGDTMANGTVSPYGTSGVASQSVWTTNGQTIVVTYNKTSGAISDAWVR